jgi:hypothetical protein
VAVAAAATPVLIELAWTVVASFGKQAMARIVETTLDIRFSAVGEAWADVESSVEGEVARQAELVCFAHEAARTVDVVGPERGLAVLQALLLLEASPEEARRATGRLGIRIVPAAVSVDSAASTRVVARFLSARRQPRMYFSMKSRASAASPLATKGELATASLYVAFDALLRRAVDPADRRRAPKTAQLLARLVAEGVVNADNEFDVALAAADVAWRAQSERGGEGFDEPSDGLHCPVCGNRGAGSPSDRGFDFRLWPSEHDAIRKCLACGSGLWLRRGQAARPIAEPVWDAMERLRDAVAEDAGEVPPSQAPSTETAEGPSRALGDLKRVFVENRWPFVEVRGAPVLVSDLSGVWGTWKFYAQVAGEHDVVLFYSICPLRVPEEQRLEAAHFLTRANHGLATGNFELDFEDGEIRYKTVVPVDGELSAAAVKRAVRANGIAMETYLPGIGAVITGTAAQPALERRVDA